ncbi:hypothetical protein GPECTOR_9g465 [Gonium pectorale]|uniref:SURF1-like protein n=1 Tax=Gonium pectorale TaxID=33097 RepID=A0A150GRI0_GONPE|nr:hypothetical protein GPECTOR_9g465 [Gonium pectorale]|eukprot:KXZ52421.1 hypothetical protein GPECTOR_9g465 [Gonium pectorale]
MFAPSAVCGCLAYWQYERMQWKANLIASRERAVDSQPVDLFSLPPGERRDYDKVSVRGRFLDEYTLYVGPRPRSVPGAGIQPGYLVITPMVAADRKGAVLVNRGWAPASWRAEAQAAAATTLREQQADEEARAAAAAKTEAAAAEATASTGGAAGEQAVKRSWWGRLFGGKPKQAEAGEQGQAAPAAKPKPEVVEVVGVIQPDEEPNRFMPANEPGRDEFHYVQRDALTSTLGLPPSTPLIMAISSDPAAAVATQQRSPLEEARAAAAAGEDDESAPGQATPRYPVPKHAGDLVRFTTMPADHRNYAAIWVSLCLVLAAMARSAVIRPVRGPRIVAEAGALGGGGSARDAWKASQAS